MDLTMVIDMDPLEAKQAADELEAHRQHLTTEEETFLAGYQALATGRPIINLQEAIAAGGCFDDGTDQAALPRLAVARPYDRWVYLHRWSSGGVAFTAATWTRWPRHGTTNRAWGVELPTGTLRPFAAGEWVSNGSRRAMVPPVPLGTRLRLGRRGAGGWRSCITLFEVGEWATAPRPPGDPALLRHLAGHLYVVEATWDLTDLERAVLAGTRTEGN